MEAGHIPPQDIWRPVNGCSRAWEYHIDFDATADRRQRDVSGADQSLQGRTIASIRGVSLDGVDSHTISTTMLSPWTIAPLGFAEQCGPAGQVRPRPHAASSQWREHLEVAASRCASRKMPSAVLGCEYGSGELRCNTTELVSPATDEISHQCALSLP